MPLPFVAIIFFSAQAANIAPACGGARDQDDVTVCGHRDEGAGYRLPQLDQHFDPAGSIDSVSRERHRLLDVGAAGTHSCSTVGPGGWTGCMLTTWQDAAQQYAGSQHRPHEGTFQLGPISVIHPQ